jgi:hypothetical protein
MFSEVIYNSHLFFNNFKCLNIHDINYKPSKFYKYLNDMCICDLCFDKYQNFKLILNNNLIKLFDDDNYFYILPHLIPIKLFNIDVFHIKYSNDIYNIINSNSDKSLDIYYIDNLLSECFIFNGMKILLDNIHNITFNINYNQLSNLFNLVQLYDYNYILPICSLDNNGNKSKNEFYLFTDLNNSSPTFFKLFILIKINGLFNLNITNYTFLDYIKLKNNYISNKYCLKCKNICKITEHKTKLTIKSMAFELFNQLNN